MLSRRRFLVGASAGSLGLMLADNHLAAAPRKTRGGGTGSSTGTTSGTATSAFVINGFDESGGNSYPFINFAKIMGSQGSNAPFQNLLNSDGYPVGSLAGSSGCASVAAVDPSLLAPNVTWVLSWQGLGGVQLVNGTTYGQTNFVVTAGSSFVGGLSVPLTLTNVMTASGVNGYIEFTNGAGASMLGLSFSPYVKYDGSMADLRLYRKSDQTALQAGEIFTPEFIANLVSLKPKIIRTMDWSSTNFNNVSRFAYRTSPTALSYYNQRWNPSLWGGITSGAGSAYICANPTGSGTGAYVNGETVQIQFHASNSVANPTLDVAGRGAVPIAMNYGAPLGIGTINANTCATLVYDAWLKVWLSDFSIVQANNVNGGLTTGVPIEVQVALCNKLNVNLWYNFPFHYDDASCAAAASYIRDNLNAGLTAYFEYSNEVWNFGLSQTSLASARGAYLGFPSANFRQIDGYYGLRVRQIMAAVTSAWAPRSASTLKRVLALWESNASPRAVDMYRLRGVDLSTQLGYANYNTVIGTSYCTGGPLFTRPIDVCDAISYATYYAGPNLGGNSGDLSSLNAADLAALKSAADNYTTAAATSNQTLLSSALAWVDNDIRRGSIQKSSVSLGPDGMTFACSGSVPSNGSVVVFSSAGSLPAGLSSTSVYFVVNATGGTFQVSIAFNGAAIAGLSGGAGGLSVGLLGGETLLWHKSFFYSDANSLGFGWEQIAASYDGYRPPGLNNLTVECYEGGLENLAPSQAQCSAAGLDGATYGTSQGKGGAIYNLLQAYKNSALAKQLALDQFTQFMAYPHSTSPAWYAIQGPNQWSLMPGNTLSPPYQTFQGLAAFAMK